MKREKNFLINSFVLLFGTVIPKLTSFIVLPILTLYLSKTEYGSYDLISVLCSLLIPIISLQIQVAAFRYLIENKENFLEKKKIISNVVLFTIFDLFLLFFIIFIIFYKFSLLIRILVCIYFILELLLTILGQIVRGLLDTKSFSISGIILSFLFMIFVIVFIYFLKLGFYGLLLSLIISNLFSIIYLFIRIKIFEYLDFSLININEIKLLLSYSWPMIPLAISMWIINASDRVVITLFLGLEANAVYAVARKIPNIINMVQSSFQTAWVESASLADKDSDSNLYYTNMFDSFFRILISVTMLVISFSPILFSFFVKGDYNDAFFQMPLLIIGLSFYGLSSFLGGIYTAKKKTINVGVTTIVAAFINILIDLLLINKLGLYAASISTLISYIFLTIYRMIDVNKFINLDYNYKLIFSMFFITFILSFMIYFESIIIYVIMIIISLILSIIINKNFINLFLIKVMNKIKKGSV